MRKRQTLVRAVLVQKPEQIIKIKQEDKRTKRQSKILVFVQKSVEDIKTKQDEDKDKKTKRCFNIRNRIGPKDLA